MDLLPFEIEFTERVKKAASAANQDVKPRYQYNPYDLDLGIPQTGDIVVIAINGKPSSLQVLSRRYDLVDPPTLTLLLGELDEIYSTN